MAIKKIEKKELIPAEFGKDSTILLISLTDDKMYNFNIKNMVKRYYHGKFEFYFEPKYGEVPTEYNLAKYRFELKTFTRSIYSGGVAFSVSLYDKKTDINYTYPTGSFYKPIYKAYLIKLDKQRIQNQ